jgi:UDP-N-acetyl-D-mannosaminuronic acid dehydrogenase
LKIVGYNQRASTAVYFGRSSCLALLFLRTELDTLLRAITTLGKLRAVSHPEPTDAFVIAVPAPFRESRSSNLDYIDLAADDRSGSGRAML